MKRCPYSLLLMLFTASVDADTLTTVIQQTLTTKPEVLMSINSQRAAAQELKQAQAGYLPSINLTAGYGRENSENITTRSRYPEGDVSLNRQELSLTLSQMLFDGFKVSNQVKRQESLVDSSSYQVDTTKEETTLQTVEAYLEILRYQKLVELAKNNVVVHQKMLARIQTLVEGGAGRQADIQQSQSRLALAKSTLIHMEGLKRNAETEYLRVTGQAPRALTYPDTELQLVKRALTDYQLTETMPPEVIETLFNTALMHHPNLEAAQAELKAAQAQHQQTNANFLPHLSLELAASNNENLDGIEGNNDDLSAMVRLRYNLYKGGADKARRQETAERLNVAKEEVRRVRRLIEREVRLAVNSLITTQNRVNYVAEHVKATEEVLDSYKEQHKLGQRSLLDVLDSENELFNARSAQVTVNYTEILSLFRILASMGLLLETLAIEEVTH